MFQMASEKGQSPRRLGWAGTNPRPQVLSSLGILLDSNPTPTPPPRILLLNLDSKPDHWML